MYRMIEMCLGVPDSCFYALQGSLGWILFDSGIGHEEALKRALDSSGICPADIRLIVITHAHFDHYANAHLLKEWSGAPVLCHKLAAEFLEAGREAPVVPVTDIGRQICDMKRAAGEADAPAENRLFRIVPDIAIREDFSLRPFGAEGSVCHTPGHTACSVSAFLPAGRTVCGDTLVSCGGDSYPGIFSVDPARHGESAARILSCSKILYQGHGGTISAAEFRRRLKRPQKL